MTISCVRHPSTGPAQPNGANASTKIPGPKSDARPYKQDRVRGFLAHALHGVHHIRALAQHGIAERLRPPGIPGHHVEHGWKRDQRQHARIERKIVLVHGSGQFIGTQITVLIRPGGRVGDLVPVSGSGQHLGQQWVGIKRDALHQVIQLLRPEQGRLLLRWILLLRWRRALCHRRNTQDTANCTCPQKSFHRHGIDRPIASVPIRGPTRDPNRARCPAPNNKGNHTHKHTDTGRRTHSDSYSRKLRWAVWCDSAHHTAARNRSGPPSGTLAAPSRWKSLSELPPGTSESAPDKD